MAKYKLRALTARQTKFIELLLQGLSIRQAAVQAGYSQRTADRGFTGVVALDRLREQCSQTVKRR